MKKMLVVYYSWSNGNTKRIAEKLANETGADIESLIDEWVEQIKRDVCR